MSRKLCETCAVQARSHELTVLALSFQPVKPFSVVRCNTSNTQCCKTTRKPGGASQGMGSAATPSAYNAFFDIQMVEQDLDVVDCINDPPADVSGTTSITSTRQCDELQAFLLTFVHDALDRAERAGRAVYEDKGKAILISRDEVVEIAAIRQCELLRWVFRHVRFDQVILLILTSSLGRAEGHETSKRRYIYYLRPLLYYSYSDQFIRR